MGLVLIGAHGAQIGLKGALGSALAGAEAAMAAQFSGEIIIEAIVGQALDRLLENGEEGIMIQYALAQAHADGVSDQAGAGGFLPGDVAGDGLAPQAAGSLILGQRFAVAHQAAGSSKGLPLHQGKRSSSSARG